MRERWQRARRSRCLARDGLTVVAESEAARTRRPLCYLSPAGVSLGARSHPVPGHRPTCAPVCSFSLASLISCYVLVQIHMFLSVYPLSTSVPRLTFAIYPRSLHSQVRYDRDVMIHDVHVPAPACCDQLIVYARPRHGYAFTRRGPPRAHTQRVCGAGKYRF